MVCRRTRPTVDGSRNVLGARLGRRDPHLALYPSHRPGTLTARSDDGQRGESKDWGSVLIEAALIIPVILVLMIGVFEVARAFFDYHLLTEAVRRAARTASMKPSLEPDDPQIRAQIDEFLSVGGLSASSSTVSFEPPLQMGQPVTVGAQVSFSSVVSGFLPGWEDPIPLRAEVVTRYEL